MRKSISWKYVCLLGKSLLRYCSIAFSGQVGGTLGNMGKEIYLYKIFYLYIFFLPWWWAPGAVLDAWRESQWQWELSGVQASGSGQLATPLCALAQATPFSSSQDTPTRSPCSLSSHHFVESPKPQTRYLKTPNHIVSIRLGLLNTFVIITCTVTSVTFYSTVLICFQDRCSFLVFCVNHCSFSRPSQKPQNQPWFFLSLLPHPTVTKSCQNYICSV